MSYHWNATHIAQHNMHEASNLCDQSWRITYTRIIVCNSVAFDIQSSEIYASSPEMVFACML